VLSSAKIGTGSWRYYTAGVACAATEYYLGVGEAPGRWHGRGLDQLGLTTGARVAERELEALFARGLHPQTGQRLGRAWRADAVTGFDLTFSAPKSVSAVWALGDREVAAGVLGAHRAAVTAGLAYLDTHAGLSRRGTDGVEQISTAGLAVALFDHRTSRAGDPQLHTHALVVNKVRCADGTWRTLDATELFHHKKSAGMIYQAALRNEMRARLGVAFGEADEHGQAEILGMPAGLLALWSKRTAAIDAEAGPKIAHYEQLLGRPLSPAERVSVVKTAVLKTRPGKKHPELTALHEHWTAEAAHAGHTPDHVLTAVLPAGTLQLAGGQPGIGNGVADDPTLARTLAGTLARPAGEDRGAPPRTGSARPASAPVVASDSDAGWGFAAVRAAGQRRAVFSRADVAGQVAAHLPTSGLSAGQVLVEVERITTLALGLAETVPVGDRPQGVTSRASDPRYATQQVLTAEARILSLAERGERGGYAPIGLPQLLVHTHALGLDPGQHQAVRELAGGGDFLSVLTALAGAGKTRTLGAAAAAWHAGGYRVVGLAPSARAAAELTDALSSTGGTADTVAKWLHTRDRFPQLPPGDRGRAWAGLDGRTVLIVDEASMASTLDLDRLVTLAAQHASKVVLVGDPAQIGVVNGPGGMLAALTSSGHASTLEEIHRFTQPWERQASLALRTGDPAVLPTYEAEGRLHACPDTDTALDQVFTHWHAAKAAGQDALMLARTRVDVDALNLRARAAALTDGQITGPTVTAGEHDWQTGDLLRTRRNNRALPLADSHVRNGDRFRVLGPAPSSPTTTGATDPEGTGGTGAPHGVLVEDLAGRGRTVLPADYLAEHCEYGWASTIDAAQGATADIGLVLVRPGIDREHLYVALTRGRHANHAYITPDTTTTDDDHHSAPRPQHTPGPEHPPGDLPTTLEPPARRVLEAALATSGAQDAAHTALAAARTAAVTAARAAAARQAAHESAERARRSDAARARTPEHNTALHHLQHLEQQRHQLVGQHRDISLATQQAREQLADTPRWARGRRRELTAALSHHDHQRAQHPAELAQLDTQLHHLQQQLQAHWRGTGSPDRAPTEILVGIRRRSGGWNTEEVLTAIPG